jgi:hypothetical protein
MMEFEITYANGEVESGICWEDCDDVVYLIQQAFEQGLEINVRLMEHDPTPEIMPIGEMF